MSVCNLGRPARDAAVQNLTVNDTVRTNKLLKATKADIGRLCASIEEVKQGNILFIGSMRYAADGESSLPRDANFFNFPSGARDVAGNISSISAPSPLDTVLYTDVDLVIQKFQGTITTVTTGSPTTEHNINLSILTGSSSAVSTNLLTLSFLNTAGNIVRETNTSASAIIPANSYYSVVIRNVSGENIPGVLTLDAAWTLELGPRV